jgi:hypothetical protein
MKKTWVICTKCLDKEHLDTSVKHHRDELYGKLLHSWLLWVIHSWDEDLSWFLERRLLCDWFFGAVGENLFSGLTVIMNLWTATAALSVSLELSFLSVIVRFILYLASQLIANRRLLIRNVNLLQLSCRSFCCRCLVMRCNTSMPRENSKD